MADDTRTIEIEADDTSDAVELPAALLDLFRETDEESDAAIVGDIVVMAFAERMHAIVHHGHGDDDESLEEIEAATMAAFEDRFGMTYGEATGHSH